MPHADVDGMGGGLMQTVTWAGGFRTIRRGATGWWRATGRPMNATWSMRPLRALQDGSGSGSEWIPADFGFTSFGFGFWFWSADLRLRVPEIFRVWGGFRILPAELNWGPKTNQPNKKPINNPRYIIHPSSPPSPSQLTPHGHPSQQPPLEGPSP